MAAPGMGQESGCLTVNPAGLLRLEKEHEFRVGPGFKGQLCPTLAKTAPSMCGWGGAKREDIHEGVETG